MSDAGEVGRLRRAAPEIILAAVAACAFLGQLGALELWGKREQRAVAESIDTVDRGHWLVAEIQNRPRLEKPPLPRWTTATLMLLTGRRDEWLMRLPAALSAVGMVALVYALGRRMGGRAVGLCAGLSLATLAYFVVEMRQAGNDGPLAFFTTLAIYCAWRRLHGAAADAPPGLPADAPGPRRWAVLTWVAMGLGFLTKGPIILLLVALAVVPYLAASRRLKPGLKLLASGWGMLAFVLLALSWPVPVLLADPKALDVWRLEMGQKVGTAGIAHHRSRGPLALDWPSLSAPWTVIASIVLILPWTRRGRDLRPVIWLPWSWAVGNLAMFCVWSVAKPNYFVPCVPAVALLCGFGWPRLAAASRPGATFSVTARRVLVGHWVVLALLGLALPVAVGILWPRYLAWSILGAALLLAGVALSVRGWRRGDDVAALAGLAGGLSALALVAFGGVGPDLNVRMGHRQVADWIERLVPGDQPVVLFYREVDEGLWYYLQTHRLQPVPGSQPRYNQAMDLVDDARNKTLIFDERARVRAEAEQLATWARTGPHESPYVLIKPDVYARMADQLAGLVTVLDHGQAMDRNEVLLLKLTDYKPAAVAHGASPTLRK